MDDKTKTEFLRGLRLVRDADNNVSLYGPDGDHVIDVRGNLGLDLSAYQIGSWVAAACRQASRTCETCHFWHDDECALWDGIPMGKQGRCDQWEAREAADA